MTQPQKPATMAPGIAQCYALALFVFYAVTVIMHRQPPLLGDLSNWTYSGVLLARHMHGLPDAFHSLRWYPVPNTTNTLLLAVLCYLVKWQLAVKLYLLLQLGLSYFAMRTLARVVRAPAWVWFIAPGAIFFGINFWYGLFAFQMGVCFVLLLAAMLIMRLDVSLRDWPVGAMLLLLFFTHMVAFTFALILVFFFAMQTGRRRLLLQAILPASLVVVYAVRRFAAGNPDGGVTLARPLPVGSALFWAYKMNTFAKSFGFVNPTAWSHSVALVRESKTLFLLLVAVNILLCIALAFLFLKNLLPRLSGDRLPFLRLTVALSIPAYLLLPTSLLGIADPGSRVIQVSLWLLLIVCHADSMPTRVAARVAALASLLLAVSGGFLFMRLPWSQQAQFTPMSVPGPVEQFGKAPYDAAADLYQALDRGDFTRAVFPTGILNNRTP